MEYRVLLSRMFSLLSESKYEGKREKSHILYFCNIQTIGVTKENIFANIINWK